MRFVKRLLIIACFCNPVFAENTDDIININQIYVTEDGLFAIEASNPISNASADRDCAVGKEWAKSWAGIDQDASPRMVSVILSAHAQKKTIKIRTNGCQGAWHKITSVSIRP